MTIEEVYQKCRDKEFHSYGTAKIFEKRAGKLKNLRTVITFLGIIIPVVIGGTVLSFGSDSKVLPYFLGIAGVAGLIQLILSTWSIVARWDEVYEYAIESARENTELYNRFKHLADTKPDEIETKANEVFQQYEQREFKDIGQNISDKENRFANRVSLMYYKKPCHICNETPNTLQASDCDGCGNF